MRQLRTYGSVRGAEGNLRPYRDRRRFVSANAHDLERVYTRGGREAPGRGPWLGWTVNHSKGHYLSG